MVAIILSASAVVIFFLAGMSLAFAQRVAPGVQLPMQWSFSGRPTWYAPRALALSFTPVLAAVVLIPIGLAALWTGMSRATDLIGILGAVGFAFLGAHAAHLGLLARWLKSHPPG